ncbi:DNA alkylation repair protein [Chelativorans salis]|uniref:DNA alkylation repair protein n=1 Tax=Chelativorans salis TaxID=2978478 RepID=A0ABT2LWM4_9HYPH|nr:DNA alkylation repair protein [Chelativorans sp. EGI FJ00035]MCT7377599.1 DNA alkylation repair protein [Chelativorans sp. EGI FJ00035]
MGVAPNTSVDRLHARLVGVLRASGDPDRAEKEKAYQKSAWGHWGVSMPKMDAVIRETLKGVAEEGMLLDLSERLWSSPVWDLKIAAARILAGSLCRPSASIWRFVLRRMSDLDGWAVADNLANVGARCIIDDPRRLDKVETWVESRHLWTRRAALVFTLPWTKPGRDPERMLSWAARLAPDREWFIQKAIGWWLRELSKHDPARVRGFLTDHGAALKGFARREATKYLPEEEAPASPPG